MDSNSIGKNGEMAARRFLRAHGYSIIEMNYSCRFGEIDIIAQNDEYIVFVEVKTRNKNYIASPCEFVGEAKQNRLIKTAQTYLSLHDVLRQPRFDVIEVVNSGRFNKKINHIENAFGV